MQRRHFLAASVAFMTAGSAFAASGQAYRRGLVEEELAGLLPAELVLLNPPRRGLDRTVSSILLERPPPPVISLGDLDTLTTHPAREGGGWGEHTVNGHADHLKDHEGHAEVEHHDHVDMQVAMANYGHTRTRRTPGARSSRSRNPRSVRPS